MKHISKTEVSGQIPYIILDSFSKNKSRYEEMWVNFLSFCIFKEKIFQNAPKKEISQNSKNEGMLLLLSDTRLLHSRYK